MGGNVLQYIIMKVVDGLQISILTSTSFKKKTLTKAYFKQFSLLHLVSLICDGRKGSYL